MTEVDGQILVVDDNRMNRIKLSRSLEVQGHTVSLAEDGQDRLPIQVRDDIAQGTGDGHCLDEGEQAIGLVAVGQDHPGKNFRGAGNQNLLFSRDR